MLMVSFLVNFCEVAIIGILGVGFLLIFTGE
jgi:hypothetical protein